VPSSLKDVEDVVEELVTGACGALSASDKVPGGGFGTLDMEGSKR
jgi:nucleoid DNA-binding protein